MFNLVFFKRAEGEMEDTFNSHLGKRLRMRRLSLGLTQTKVANAINVTFQQIQKYEKGTNGVSSSRLMQLANFLKVPITYFYEDFPSYKADTETTNTSSDLNYSFLVKTFSKLSETEKSKVLQILRNAVNLKETG
tara:strand:- start:41 stop:445 length:405 start_codon:yes stop_codon:yes gene_type:complete